MTNNEFNRVIELHIDQTPLTNDNVGEKLILVPRGSFNLIISKRNSESHGEFLVQSIEGHDCWSYNSQSKHTYKVLDGEVTFYVVKGLAATVTDEEEIFVHCDAEGNLVRGEGGEIVPTEVDEIRLLAGESIEIEPNRVFYYKGTTLMKLSMEPNFKAENDHMIKRVSYDEPKTNTLQIGKYGNIHRKK